VGLTASRVGSTRRHRLQDAEGYVHIVDRKKDMIIAGAYNIYPRRWRRFSLSHPNVERGGSDRIA